MYIYFVPNKNYKEQIDSSLEKLIPPTASVPERLHQAMRYSVFSGGKRIRPILLLAVTECLGRAEDPLPAVAAIECLHTYSLIHDDLPICDNSDFRRNLPTCHKKFDDITALLAGDALLTLAFEILSSNYAQNPSLAVELTKCLARASGSLGMVGGQMEDCARESKPSLKTITRIHLRKTAKLIRCALEMGFLLSEQRDSVEIRRKIRKIGNCIGFAFQLQDDLLDKETDELNFTNFLSEDEVSAIINKLYAKANNLITSLKGNKTCLLSIIEMLKGSAC